MGTDEHTNAHARGAAQEVADDERDRAAGLHRVPVRTQPYASTPTPAGQIPRPLDEADAASNRDRWRQLAVLARDVATLADHMATSTEVGFRFDPVDVVEDHLYRMSRLATSVDADPSEPPRFRMSMPAGLAEALNDLLACGYDAKAQLPAIEAVVAIWRGHYAELERAIAAMTRSPVRAVIVNTIANAPENHCTWSVVASVDPMHTTITVRHGFEGSRAMLGSLCVDRRDVAAARAVLADAARAVTTTAIKATADAMIDRLPPTMKVTELRAMLDTIAASIAATTRDKLESAIARGFGLRIDP